MRLEQEIKDRIRLAREMLRISMNNRDLGEAIYQTGWVEALKWVLQEKD
ncbi:MAG: hypothetical protein ACTSVW_00465 [Candidatus Njordarchaeales archaeon]